MKIWVVEYNHGTHSHGVLGLAATLDEGIARVKAHAGNVNWSPLSKAVIGGAWILNGTWDDRLYTEPRFVQYRFTEHVFDAASNEEGKK